MKQGILVVAGLILASGMPGVAAAQPMPVPPPPVYRGEAYPPPSVQPYVVAPAEIGMPSYDVVRVLRRNGFLPLGRPSRRGDYYSVSAIHPNGDDGRAVVDAYTGRIVRFVPASRFIRAHGGEEMMMVRRGADFPPVRSSRGSRPSPMDGAAIVVVPPVSQPAPARPQIVSRTPPATPVPSPQKRPRPAAKQPSTAQAPPPAPPPAAKPQEPAPPPAAAAVETPVETKPATPASPPIAPTQAMPPVQTLE